MPKDLDTRRHILYECHDSPSACHPSIRKTYALVRRQFFWLGLHNDVHEYVLKCQRCQVNKAERLKASGLLQPLEIPHGKWESISMDLIVGFVGVKGSVPDRPQCVQSIIYPPHNKHTLSENYLREYRPATHGVSSSSCALCMLACSPDPVKWYQSLAVRACAA